MSKFRITDAKGFQMTFANGWTISVQFGYLNYCANKRTKDNEGEDIESENAEIAIWDKHHTWYNFGRDTVKGYVEPDDVAKWVTLVSNFDSDATKEKIDKIRSYIEVNKSKGYDVYLVEKSVMCLDTSGYDANFGFEVVATNRERVITEGTISSEYESISWVNVLSRECNLIVTSSFDGGNRDDGMRGMGMVVETFDCDTLLVEHQGITIY
jgi:hypothetical protein